MNWKCNSTTHWVTHCPTAGGTLEVAPGVKWMRMGLPFALNHINLWLLRDSIDGPSRGLEHCGLLHPQRRGQGPVGIHFCQRAAGPAHPARHRHPHAPRPHWPGALVVRALERGAVCGSAPPITRWHAWAAWAPPVLVATGRRIIYARMALNSPEPWSRSRNAPTTSRPWCPRCQRSFRRLMDGTVLDLRGARVALPSAATAMRPSTWRCTAKT
jgi:hypothetical protein